LKRTKKRKPTPRTQCPKCHLGLYVNGRCENFACDNYRGERPWQDFVAYPPFLRKNCGD
jgi:hypothetical protein